MKALVAARLLLLLLAACGAPERPAAFATAPSAGGSHLAAEAIPLNGSELDDAVRKLRPKVTECYQAGLALDPSIRGRVVFAVVVDEGGVSTVTIVRGGEGLGTEVLGCIGETLRASRLPISRTNKARRVNVPFRLEPLQRSMPTK